MRFWHVDMWDRHTTHTRTHACTRMQEHTVFAFTLGQALCSTAAYGAPCMGSSSIYQDYMGGLGPYRLVLSVQKVEGRLGQNLFKRWSTYRHSPQDQKSQLCQIPMSLIRHDVSSAFHGRLCLLPALCVSICRKGWLTHLTMCCSLK
jgi:hypothetical protein